MELANMRVAFLSCALALFVCGSPWMVITARAAAAASSSACPDAVPVQATEPLEHRILWTPAGVAAYSTTQAALNVYLGDTIVFVCEYPTNSSSNLVFLSRDSTDFDACRESSTAGLTVGLKSCLETDTAKSEYTIQVRCLPASLGGIVSFQPNKYHYFASLSNGNAGGGRCVNETFKMAVFVQDVRPVIEPPTNEVPVPAGPGDTGGGGDNNDNGPPHNDPLQTPVPSNIRTAPIGSNSGWSLHNFPQETILLMAVLWCFLAVALWR